MKFPLKLIRVQAQLLTASKLLKEGREDQVRFRILNTWTAKLQLTARLGTFIPHLG